MTNPAISIIVPVYRAEKYIHRCLDSICHQTFGDWECILVDDGSPDMSGAICEKYKANDTRFRVIHKSNGGVSSARQAGLESACGEYVIHADPDDYIEPRMLEALHNTAKQNNADMVICDYFENTRHRQRYIKQAPEDTTAKACLVSLLTHKLHGSCWNKLVRRSCFETYGIHFPSNIIRWEDLYVNCLLLMHDLVVAYLPEAFYHYDLCVNEDSIVRKPTQKGLSSQIDFCNELDGILPDDVRPYLYSCKLNTKILSIISGIYTIEEAKELFAEVNNDFLAHNKGKRLFAPARYLYDSLSNKSAFVGSLRYRCYSLLEKCKTLCRKVL